MRETNLYMGTSTVTSGGNTYAIYAKELPDKMINYEIYNSDGDCLVKKELHYSTNSAKEFMSDLEEGLCTHPEEVLSNGKGIKKAASSQLMFL